MIFSFSRMGMRQCLPVVALLCLTPAAMAAPPTAAPVASPDKTEAVKQAIQAVYDTEDVAAGGA